MIFAIPSSPKIEQMELVVRIGRESNQVWAIHGVSPTAVEVPKWLLKEHNLENAISLYGLTVIPSDNTDSELIFLIPSDKQ